MSILQPFKKSTVLGNRPENDLFYSLQTDVNRLFNSFFSEFVGSDELSSTRPIWAPRVDIKETAQSYIITADLPGAKKEDINISVHDNILTIKGERKSETQKNVEKQHINERFYGVFERSFTLPQKYIDLEKVSAEMQNGELKITITKVPESQKEIRKIEIK